MNLLDTFQISASGLTAQRVRLETIASNLANARTTRTGEGVPYARRVPVFQSGTTDPFGDELERAMSAVEVSEIAEDQRPPLMVYEPSHPDANPEGYVAYPNVSLLQEMVDMVETSRAYEANTKVVTITGQMANNALSIGAR